MSANSGIYSTGNSEEPIFHAQHAYYTLLTQKLATPSAIDMALLKELCSRANTPVKTLKNPAVRAPGWLFRVNCHAKHLERDLLAGALEWCRAPESGSKLHALQALRAVRLRHCRRESIAFLWLNSPFKNPHICSSRGNEALFCSRNCRYQSLVTSAATSLTDC